MNFAKPPTSEPIARSDGRLSDAWAKWFDALTRDVRFSQDEGGYGSVLTVLHDLDVPGYVKADGREISREANPKTFAALGTNFGFGDNATTFNVPTLSSDGVRRFHVRVEQG